MNYNKHSCSFRDPGGYLLKVNKDVYRVVREPEKNNFCDILKSPIVQKHISNNNLVETKVLDSSDIPELSESILNQDLLAQHETIPFPSYPYEWSPGMLQSAGLLTLQLAQELMKENIGLKDGTPYNVLFKGPNPVFVDMLSFEKRDPNDPIWKPYAQFLRTFVLPLLAHHEFKIPLNQIFLTRRDGIESEELYSLLKGFHKWRPKFLSLVTLPSLMARLANKQKETSLYQKRTLNNPKKAQFILAMVYKKLKKSLAKMNLQSTSHWSGYMTLEKSYSDDQFKHKDQLVTELIRQMNPKRVLDIGCNKGHFSMIAARQQAEVVAIDFDSAVIDKVWRAARAQKLDILPLVVDISRPSPGTGWNNTEHLSFLDRAKGHFDLVLMLAVIHHLLAQERIPLAEIFQMAHGLTTKDLIIEYVHPEDPMFKKIARGRDHLYAYLTQEHFEMTAAEFFTICSKTQIADSKRCLYHLRRIS